MNNIPDISNGAMTKFPSAMPDSCKISDNPIINYREFYHKEKAAFAKWKTQAPEWWTK